MRGGIAPGSAKAIIAICIIFSPVILVGGAAYGTYAVARAGVNKVQSTVNNRTGERKRTSNLIAKQRNRMVKKVGAANFDNYIQQLFNNAKSAPTPDTLLELGTALFLNNDLQGAYQYITDALEANSDGEWPKKGSAHFVRGMVNQYLYDFEGAIKDYQEAKQYLPESGVPAGADALPQLSKYDAINASGYAKMLKCFYSIYGANAIPDSSIPQEESKQLLASALEDITAAINGSTEKQGMWHHNRGYTRYFRTFMLPEEEREAELKLAISDFDAAITSDNFGTTAEGHSMKAQALALLGQLEEADQEQLTAQELDHKVFYVNLRDPGCLRVPWPLPKEKFRGQTNQHSFTEKQFHRPHYCDHCSELIKIERGYLCYVCDYRVHSSCFPRVKGKDCWVRLKQEARNSNSQELLSEDHVHHLKPTRFHKPTWCKLCLKLVASPFGKQGLQCKDCGVKLHKDCVDLVGKHFIENE
jgi:hypothetical protein